jgi:hypothetical protein
MHTKRLKSCIYKTLICCSARAPRSGNPKYEYKVLQLPTKHSCYYRNKRLKYYSYKVCWLQNWRKLKKQTIVQWSTQLRLYAMYAHRYLFQVRSKKIWLMRCVLAYFLSFGVANVQFMTSLVGCSFCNKPDVKLAEITEWTDTHRTRLLFSPLYL